MILFHQASKQVLGDVDPNSRAVPGTGIQRARLRVATRTVIEHRNWERDAARNAK